DAPSQSSPLKSKGIAQANEGMTSTATAATRRKNSLVPRTGPVLHTPSRRTAWKLIKLATRSLPAGYLTRSRSLLRSIESLFLRLFQHRVNQVHSGKRTNTDAPSFHHRADSKTRRRRAAEVRATAASRA